MKLADYLKLPGKSASALAAETGSAVSTITRVANGDISPSRSLVLLIHEKTGGAVTPNDIFGIAEDVPGQAAA